MRGKITKLDLYSDRKKYGFIDGNDGITYYFNQDSLFANVKIDSFYIDDDVHFEVEKTKVQYDRAIHVELVSPSKIGLSELPLPGVSQRLNLVKAAEEHLKPGSGEYEVVKKLAEVLRITRVGHHSMDQSSTFQFLLVSVTAMLKQFVRESGEFIVVFSHFDNKRWQQKTLKVERELRKRRDIIDRSPLVNFYLLISNASELRAKINNIKGEPHAAIIPFSFEELIACENSDELVKCILARFGEYYYENNMLGENDAIDDDNLLFGDRGKIADSVAARCHQGSNSGIFGLRRSGKTSVLNAVLRRFDLEGTPYVLIESRTYETFSSWKSVLFEVACLIKSRMQNTERKEDESLSEFRNRLHLASTEEDYEERGVACFIDDVHLYCGENKLVIALDEIELITYNTATSEVWKSLEAYKGFWSALRGCGCSLIVCGVNSTINEVSNLSYNNDYCDNPMYGRIINCYESRDTYLPPFTNAQTKEMINTLGQYSNIAFSNVYVQINNAFGGQPWAIRQFCSFVLNNVRDNRTPVQIYEVTKATCDALMRQFQNSSTGVNLCETILQHLSIYRAEYSLLKNIALSPDKYNAVSREDTTSIDHLQKYGLVDYDSDTGYISFRIDIIKDHICKTETKSPKDMDNTERRRYVQDRIAICERKLKRYLQNYYTYASTPTAGRALFFTSGGKCILTPHKGITPGSCQFADFFDHRKFDFYFSKLKRIIRDNWSLLGMRFTDQGITEEKFTTCMEDLNAGRTDADHYDPENSSSCPDNWEIDELTMQAFETAYDTFEHFFASIGL